MDKSVRQITEGLFKAIQAEIEGQHFYMMAAHSTEDAKGKEVFTMLAEDEKAHAAFLKKQYDSFSRTGKADESASLGQQKIIPGMSPIFSEKLKARVNISQYEMSALSIAIQLELNAIQFYKSEAEKVEDEGIKKFYFELADWESGHYNMLLAQQETLKEDYWQQQGFAPF